MRIVKMTDDYFTCKKTRVTFLLSVMVLLLHISTLANYTLDSEMGKLLLIFDDVIHAACEVAVPLFFVISGVLFYRNYTLKLTKKKYKSRFFSLVIPYWFWNFIWTVFSYICSYTFIRKFFIGRSPAVFSVFDFLQGIFFHKYTIFWFIFDLIVFIAICPVIYILLKNRIVGLVIISIVTVLYGFHIHLPEMVFLRGDAIIYYLLGAYIGLHYNRWFVNKPNKKVQAVAMAVAILCVIYILVSQDRMEYSFFNAAVRCAYCLAFWYSFDLFSSSTYYYEFEKESFLIYAMHINVLAVITKLLYIALPKSDVFALINWLATLFLTVAAICYFAMLLKRFCPKIKTIICGR